MKLLLVLLPCFFIIISVSSSPSADSWRTKINDDAYSNPWRNQLGSMRSRKAEFLGNDDDPNNWRNQKRSLLGFPSIDAKRFPFYSYFERLRMKNDKKNEEPDVSVQTWEGDQNGIINCPPDVPKCIPRLGR